MKHYLIAGNSTAGLAAVRALRQHDPRAKITVVSAERHLPYSRVLLTHLIAGHVDAGQLALVEPSFFEQPGLELLAGRQVVQVDPKAKTVTLDDAVTLPYDKLLLATGAGPVIPAGFSTGYPQVTGLRTLEDAALISRHAAAGAKIAVVGGGPVGVKLACALREAGASPELIVSSPRLLSRVADDEAAAMVRRHMSQCGIRIRTTTVIVHLEQSRDGGALITLSDGTSLPCRLVVFCKGVRPHTSMLGGLQPPGAALRVDRWMRTSFEDIYAAGDVAETYEISSRSFCTAATWPHAVEQGRVAAMNMAGLAMAYRGSLNRNAMDILGLPFISIGLVKAPSRGGYDLRIQRNGNSYRKLVYRRGRLVGIQLIGDVREAGFRQAQIRRAAARDIEIESTMCCEEEKHE